MRQHSRMALMALLVAAAAQAQEVNVFSTTMAQVWKSDTPGFDKSTYAPATEFLGIDATKLGSEAVSLHLYGWGRTDLKEQSAAGGKTAGNLTYGYLLYSFDRANAELKAGRFTVNQGIGSEAVDGVSARTDLIGGFTFSFFAGKPVVFKNLSDLSQRSQDFQRDFIFGSRLSYRVSRWGEVGVSFLQDGSTAAKDLPRPEPVDYTRKQMAADFKLSPFAFLDLSGRSVFDVAKRDDPDPAPDRNRFAEHDYSAQARLAETLSLTGSFVERNYFAYYAGSTLPTLFDMKEKGQFKASGATLAWGPLAQLQIVGDVRRTQRELYGDTTRFGAEARCTFAPQHLLAGLGYHRVNAFDVRQVDALRPSFSLSHHELRAWVMMERGKYSASLDAIRLNYSDAADNPALGGRSNETEVVASLGYQAATALKVSGDVSFSDTPLAKKQVTGLLRAEYRFGFTAKGGK